MSAYSPAPITTCDRCGAELAPGARYCANCGQAVGNSASTFASPPAQTTLPVNPYTSPGSSSAWPSESRGGIGKLFSGDGRIGRLEYFLIVLGVWLVLLVLWGIIIAADAPGVTIVLGIGSWLLAVSSRSAPASNACTTSTSPAGSICFSDPVRQLHPALRSAAQRRRFRREPVRLRGLRLGDGVANRTLASGFSRQILALAVTFADALHIMEQQATDWTPDTGQVAQLPDTLSAREAAQSLHVHERTIGAQSPAATFRLTSRVAFFESRQAISRGIANTIACRSRLRAYRPANQSKSSHCPVGPANRLSGFLNR